MGFTSGSFCGIIVTVGCKARRVLVNSVDLERALAVEDLRSIEEKIAEIRTELYRSDDPSTLLVNSLMHRRLDELIAHHARLSMQIWKRGGLLRRREARVASQSAP